MKPSRNAILAGSGFALAAAMGLAARHWIYEKRKSRWSRMVDQGQRAWETGACTIKEAALRARRRILAARIIIAVGRKVL